MVANVHKYKIRFFAMSTHRKYSIGTLSNYITGSANTIINR